MTMLNDSEYETLLRAVRTKDIARIAITITYTKRLLAQIQCVLLNRVDGCTDFQLHCQEPMALTTPVAEQPAPGVVLDLTIKSVPVLQSPAKQQAAPAFTDDNQGEHSREKDCLTAQVEENTLLDLCTKGSSQFSSNESCVSDHDAGPLNCHMTKQSSPRNGVSGAFPYRQQNGPLAEHSITQNRRLSRTTGFPLNWQNMTPISVNHTLMQPFYAVPATLKTSLWNNKPPLCATVNRVNRLMSPQISPPRDTGILSHHPSYAGPQPVAKSSTQTAPVMYFKTSPAHGQTPSDLSQTGDDSITTPPCSVNAIHTSPTGSRLASYIKTSPSVGGPSSQTETQTDTASRDEQEATNISRQRLLNAVKPLLHVVQPARRTSQVANRSALPFNTFPPYPRLEVAFPSRGEASSELCDTPPESETMDMSVAKETYEHNALAEPQKVPIPASTENLQGSGNVHRSAQLASYIFPSKRPVKCTICSKVVRADNIRVHMRRHTGEKPYQCPHCPFRSSNPSSMPKHMKLHGVSHSIFSCDTCAHSSTYKSNINLHMRTHHGVGRKYAKFRCSMCKLPFPSKCLLDSHVNSIHPNQASTVSSSSSKENIVTKQD